MTAATIPTVASTTGPRRAQRRIFGSSFLLGAVGLVLFALVWEISPRTGLVDDRYFPTFSAVVSTLVKELTDATYWSAVGVTMKTWATGLGIATLAGGLGGFAVGLSVTLRRFTTTTVEFLRPIPSVALIPVAVLAFGVSMTSILSLVIYACFWQVFIQVMYGAADVDSVARSTARVYGLGPLAQLRYVVFPTSLPFLMTGIRLAGTVALVLTITGELVIGTPGLGSRLLVAQASGAIEKMFALVVVAGLLGVIIDQSMRRIERYVLRWHPSVRSEVAA